jgi:hypothetical protein
MRFGEVVGARCAIHCVFLLCGLGWGFLGSPPLKDAPRHVGKAAPLIGGCAFDFLAQSRCNSKDDLLGALFVSHSGMMRSCAIFLNALS